MPASIPPSSPAPATNLATAGPADQARLEADARAIIARYPVPRSALLPMLHLVQSEEGFVSPDGIAFCARMLDLTTAEVAAVGSPADFVELISEAIARRSRAAP